MKKMSLGAKLIVFFLLVGLIPFGIIGVTSYVKSSNALSDAAYGQLRGMREIKKTQISQFFDERRGDMGVLTETVKILRKEAFEKLEALREIKKNQIQGFFEERMGDALVLADNPFIKEAFIALDTSFEAGGGANGRQFKGYTNGKFDAPYLYKRINTIPCPGKKSFMHIFPNGVFFGFGIFLRPSEKEETNNRYLI